MFFHYLISQAITIDRTVYVSGCLGLDKDTLTLVSGGAGPEMRKTLENMVGILEAAGSSVDKVVKTMIFVSDLKDFGAINDEYKKGMSNVVDSWRNFNIYDCRKLMTRLHI